MAIYNMAGHNNRDSGSVAGGFQENKKTIEFRDLVNKYLNKSQYRVINDNDNDSLSTMLSKLKSGSGSVCIEWHFDEADNSEANGTSAFVKDNPTKLSVAMGSEITAGFSKIMGTMDRGVKTPSQSHRGSLAMPKMEGTTALVEVQFLSNKAAMASYEANKEKLAEFAASIMQKYDDMVK